MNIKSSISNGMKSKNFAQIVILIGVFTLILTGCVNIFNSDKRATSRSDIKSIGRQPAGQIAILDQNITISNPLDNQTIISPIEISGRARVFEGLVLFRVRDSQNNIIANSSIETGIGAPEWGAYSISLNYPQPPTPSGFIEVYTQSAKDGSDQDLISLPVQFADYKNPVVNIYFSNINKDPELLNCDVVYPVTRKIPFSDNILGRVLGVLFDGLTEAEVEQGFVNNLPEEGVQLISMSLATTTLTLDFNKGLGERVSGTCRTTAIRAQLTQTMSQFEIIDEIIISIEGETEDILQP